VTALYDTQRLPGLRQRCALYADLRCQRAPDRQSEADIPGPGFDGAAANHEL